MSGNTRGTLKEKMESIHRNCEWIMKHCEDSAMLVGGRNQKLSDALWMMGKLAEQIDRAAQRIYAEI